MANFDSMNTLIANLKGLQGNKHFPFRAYLRVVPAQSGGRRWVTIRDGQKTALFIEDDLNLAGWNIAEPVSYVPQFGNKTGKVTIVGFIERVAEESGNAEPTTDVTIIHSGTVPGQGTQQFTGNKGGGHLTWAQDTLAATDALVSELKTALEESSTVIGETAIIEKIDFNGVWYGLGGRSFVTL